MNLHIGGACALVIITLTSGCSNSDSEDTAVAPATKIVPMALCNQCLARICTPCTEKNCVPALKAKQCKISKSALSLAMEEASTDEEKLAGCQWLHDNCDDWINKAIEGSRRVTPEDDPLAYAATRVRKAKEVVSEAKLRRRVLACEVIKRVKAQDRSERITRKMLETRPRRYKGRPVYFDGRVIKLADHEAVKATVFLISVGRMTVSVIYPELTDIVRDQQVRFFGYVIGDHSYTTVRGWNMTVPQVAAVAVGSRRELHPRVLHCPDDLPRIGED